MHFVLSSSVTILTTIIMDMTKIFKLIQEYLFCQSFEIWSINSLSCIAVFLHITFLEDIHITVHIIVIINVLFNDERLLDPDCFSQSLSSYKRIPRKLNIVK